MGNHLFTFVFLLVYAKSIALQYDITSSLNPCPHDHCITLSEFTAANYSSSYHDNISLVFLPGNHSLDTELSIFGTDNFLMTKNVPGDYGTVFVECNNRSGRFDISETTSVLIKGLNFVGCGGNRASQVDRFIVEDTIFQGIESRGTALLLMNVTAASIARSSFLSNKHGPYFEQHNLSHHASTRLKLDYLYRKRNSSFQLVEHCTQPRAIFPF